jgi:hypothetical protein
MKKTKSVAAAIACCFLSATAAAQAPKWGPHLDVEAKPGTKRSLGEADLFVPLAQDARTLWFGNLRGRFDDDSNREGNLGVGVRRMYEGGRNFGGYGYLDRRKTENGNYFSQATLGAEALGRDWDLRANAYLPYGDKVRDLGTTNTASVSASTVLVSSVTTEERALKGFDAEVGWRVPLFDADAPTQLRVYAGGYRFKDDAVSLSGPRVRVELTMAEVSWLWQRAQLMLGAEAQDDNVRGGQTYASLRLRIPLGGKAERPRLNWQERRMTAPVVRDVDIVAPVVTRAPVVETATVLADGRAFSVLNSETTAGAALPGAVAAAGANSVVILSGTFTTTAATVMQTGQTLAGAISVRTASGRTATTPSATINATVSGGSAIDAVNNSTIIGLTMHNNGPAGTGARGIGVIGATGVTIANNTISASDLVSNSSNGIVVNTGGSATITGNTIRALGNSTGIATAINVLATGTVTVTNNILSASGATDPTRNRIVGMAPGATVNAGSTGNTAVSGVCLGTGANGFVSFTNGTTCP